MPDILLVILLLFATTLPTVMWLISRWSGWHSLARRFPAKPPAPNAARGFGGLRFSPLGGYNNCILWRADDDHLHLRIIPPFNIFHPALSIPWAHIDIVKPGGRWGLTTITIEGRRYGIPAAAAVRELEIRRLMSAEPAPAER